MYFATCGDMTVNALQYGNLVKIIDNIEESYHHVQYLKGWAILVNTAHTKWKAVNTTTGKYLHTESDMCAIVNIINEEEEKKK